MNAERQLDFGADRPLVLTISEEDCVAHVGHPLGPFLQDPVQAVRDQLNSPRDFPPLVEATVPGDRIAIAVNHGVPDAAGVVAGIVNSLIAGGRTEPEKIRIVLASDWDRPEQITSRLSESLSRRVRVTVHQPENGQGLAYLAASREGRAILLNRFICDADMVIPVACQRAQGESTDRDDESGVFPAFSDSATQGRFLARESWETPASREERRQEIDEAAWLLGTSFAVTVVPASGDRLLEVFAGEAASVQRRGADVARNHWEAEVPRRASMVVAAISGGRDQQTWENLTRALSAAARVVQPDGAIVICSQLDQPLAPALASVMDDAHDELEVRDELEARDAWEHRGDSDAVPAQLLREVRDHARVYLLSKLDDHLVEDLGATPVHNTAEISNLLSQQRDCILIANAQFAVPSVLTESIPS